MVRIFPAMVIVFLVLLRPIGRIEISIESPKNRKNYFYVYIFSVVEDVVQPRPVLHRDHVKYVFHLDDWVLLSLEFSIRRPAHLSATWLNDLRYRVNVPFLTLSTR